MEEYYEWVMSTTGIHCPSCKAASEQVHTIEEWNAAGVIPHSDKLYCKQNCGCWLALTDKPPIGDINSIPLRYDNHLSEDDQYSERVTLSSTPTRNGFEIFAITGGVGNGYTFPADVLNNSLSLWDNTECFIDHSLNHRSIKDLAGVCKNPRFDNDTQGIKLDLQPFGPGADVLTEIGRELLSANNKSKSSIGFSADLIFTALNKKVTQIIKVNSVDLVHKPARGGAFIRALNSEGVLMNDEISNPVPPETAELDTAKAQRLQLCSYVLESGLAASKLPAPMTERVRAQFAGKEFAPAELEAAIADARNLVTALTGQDTVKGPRITGMFSSEDQIKAAVADMFEVDRDPGLESIKPARLQGIRELYHTLTGDYDMVGGYHPERMQLATTADFTGLVKNALNKLIAKHWGELGRAGYSWWEKIVTVEHFNSLNDITGTLIGTVGSLPTVAEGAEYTELAIGDSPETSTWTKYGGYIPLTLELIDRDQTRKLKAYPRELASAGLRNISSLVSAIFTSASGAGPTMADGGALFNSTAVTTTGGHANLLTTALAAAQWEVVCAAVYNQPLLVKNATGYTGIGPKMAINPRYLLVPRALQLTAMKIIYPTLENASNIYSENLQRGQPGDVITVPEWTDATDFAAIVDPAIAPAIFVGERFGITPEIFIANNELSPAVFTNDEHRMKVRHFLSVWVNDYRPLHKSNVAG